MICPPGQPNRVARLLSRMIIVGTVLWVTAAPLAHADPIGTAGPVMMFNPADSYGVPLWNYQLSIGMGWADPLQRITGIFVSLCWDTYRSAISFGLWIVDFAMGFGWLDVVAAPLTTVGAELGKVMGKLGLVVLFLTISAAVAGYRIVRGRTGSGLLEIAVACVVASLAAGVFAQPVQMVIGKGGLAYDARDFSIAVATDLGEPATPGQIARDHAATTQTGQPDRRTESEKNKDRLIAAMVTTFIRQPVQAVNFAQVFDGGPCEQVYTDAVTGDRRTPDDPKIRNKVGTCAPAAEKFADHPSNDMVATAYLMSGGGLVVLVVMLILAGAVILAGLWLIFASIKAVVHLVVGILPGAARDGLFTTIADLMVGTITLVFANVFLGVYMQVVRDVYAAKANQPSQAFAVTVVMSVAGVIIFLIARKRLDDWRAKAAQLMSRAGGGGTPGGSGGGRAGALGVAAASAGLQLAVSGARGLIRTPRSTRSAPVGPSGPAAAGATTASSRTVLSVSTSRPPASEQAAIDPLASAVPGQGSVAARHAATTPDADARSDHTDGPVGTSEPESTPAGRLKGRIGQKVRRAAGSGVRVAALAASGGTVKLLETALTVRGLAQTARQARRTVTSSSPSRPAAPKASAPKASATPTGARLVIPTGTDGKDSGDARTTGSSTGNAPQTNHTAPTGTKSPTGQKSPTDQKTGAAVGRRRPPAAPRSDPSSATTNGPGDYPTSAPVSGPDDAGPPDRLATGLRHRRSG